MLGFLSVILATSPQYLPVRVERSRDTIPTVAAGVSTSLDTNGSGNGQARTPIDAERAFSADAKTLGQWTTFRKWSTDDAVMFVPQPVNAHEFLKDRKDPPKVIDWWPTASWISCDGTLAVNSGGWTRSDGQAGYFTPLWKKQADGGWKWIVDGGDGLTTPQPRPANPTIKRAKCEGVFDNRIFVLDDGDKGDHGGSADNSLSWFYVVKPDGSREFSAELNGRNVIDDKIPASPK